MLRIKPNVDVILDILKETLAFFPTSTFVESLLYQYQERGNLSKKQLEGLYNKAEGIPSLSPGKLATLEAIILKKPTRHKSPLPQPAPLPQIDNTAMKTLIIDILEKYPQHKRVLFIKMKLENNEVISPLERSEIDRFHKLLNKTGS
ncbi:MAG: hypothetical protein ABIN94_01085 [Ferruginibacter sp.]